MKKLFLLFILFLFTSAIFSQTLFTYGNNAVSKDEFLRAYNKNKTAVVDKNKALREYLDLYIRFRLKVKAAQDMRLDTLSSLSSDLQNFRTQIEETYLNDEKQLNILIDEAFNRSQKDIHIAYLFIPLDKSAGPADTMKAFSNAQVLYKAVTRNETTEQVARELKDQSVSTTWADAGFITVFSLPYQFENIVYQLKPSEISKPYRTKTGYYIFKNIEERKAAGKMKAAQILISVPEGAGAEQKAAAGKLADSVYAALRAGGDFSDMAKRYSDDKMTYMAGGIIPEFGTGKYDPVFENKAFALQKDNDITPPFQTKFGYHILKRLSRTPVPDDRKDANYTYILKQEVQQDERIHSAKEKFVNEILKKLNYKKNTAVNEKDLWNITDSFIVSGKKPASASLNEKTVLFSLNNNTTKVADWLKYARDYRASALYKGESDKELMDKFISFTALENYRKKLEEYNADFKYQLQEFKEGNMLFEVMERNVWTKASNDSVGLKNYYELNKNKYIWNGSADAVLLSCSNEKVAKDAADHIRKGKSWQQEVSENSSQIQSDSARYELTQLPVKEKTNLVAGLVTEPVVNETDGTASFVKILKVYPPNQQRNFEEARGLVINDYQNFLEEKWIDQLKKKYPVKINEKVFTSIVE